MHDGSSEGFTSWHCDGYKNAHIVIKEFLSVTHFDLKPGVKKSLLSQSSFDFAVWVSFIYNISNWEMRNVHDFGQDNKREEITWKT
jgi:hypothetical protein